MIFACHLRMLYTCPFLLPALNYLLSENTWWHGNVYDVHVLYTCVGRITRRLASLWKLLGNSSPGVHAQSPVLWPRWDWWLEGHPGCAGHPPRLPHPWLQEWNSQYHEALVCKVTKWLWSLLLWVLGVYISPLSTCVWFAVYEREKEREREGGKGREGEGRRGREGGRERERETCMYFIYFNVLQLTMVTTSRLFLTATLLRTSLVCSTPMTMWALANIYKQSLNVTYNFGLDGCLPRI